MAVPWTPEYIDTALWLDAADSSTLTLESGAVAQWADKSGNNHHATQTTASSRPATGSMINTLNALSFTGTFLDVPSFRITPGQAFAFFAVATLSSSSSNYARLFSLRKSGYSKDYNNAYSAVVINRRTDQNYIGTEYNNNVYGERYVGYDTVFIVCAEFGTNHFTNYINGFSGFVYQVSHTIDNTDGARICNSLNIVTELWHGLLGEIIVSWSEDTNTRQKIEGYLAHKWGLTANLPNDHPYKSTAPVVASISGTITDRLGNPCQRKVYAVSRPTDTTAPRILAHTLSDPVTGAYTLGLTTTEEVTRVVVSEDDSNPLLNDIVDRVIPE